jgi:internalin A
MPTTFRLAPAALVLVLALGGAACDAPKASPQPVSGAPAQSTLPRPQDSSAVRDFAASSPSGSPAVPVARKRKDPASCPKDGSLVFDDPTTEAAVRRQLQKPTGAVARAELKKVRTLDLSQAPKNDELDPCLFPYLTGLKGLYLAPGDLDDISPLKAATSLESLRVSATKVTDISPLSGLTKLDRLDLGRTPVRDVRPLSTLVNLTELELDDTEVSDVAPLAQLGKLEKLLIKRTRVSDIGPLRGLKKLKDLYIEGSLVKDVSALSGVQGLRIHEGP